MNIDKKEFDEKIGANLWKEKPDDRIVITTLNLRKHGVASPFVRFKFIGDSANKITKNGSFVYSNPNYCSKMYLKQADANDGFRICFQQKTPYAYTRNFFVSIRDNWEGEYPLRYDIKEKLYFIWIKEKILPDGVTPEQLSGKSRIEYPVDGMMLTLPEIARKYGISRNLLANKIYMKHMTMDEALAYFLGREKDGRYKMDQNQN